MKVLRAIARRRGYAKRHASVHEMCERQRSVVDAFRGSGSHEKPGPSLAQTHSTVHFCRR